MLPASHRQWGCSRRGGGLTAGGGRHVRERGPRREQPAAGPLRAGVHAADSFRRRRSARRGPPGRPRRPSPPGEAPASNPRITRTETSRSPSTPLPPRAVVPVGQEPLRVIGAPERLAVQAQAQLPAVALGDDRRGDLRRSGKAALPLLAPEDHVRGPPPGSRKIRVLDDLQPSRPRACSQARSTPSTGVTPSASVSPSASGLSVTGRSARPGTFVPSRGPSRPGPSGAGGSPSTRRSPTPGTRPGRPPGERAERADAARQVLLATLAVTALRPGFRRGALQSALHRPGPAALSQPGLSRCSFLPRGWTGHFTSCPGDCTFLRNAQIQSFLSGLSLAPFTASNAGYRMRRGQYSSCAIRAGSAEYLSVAERLGDEMGA